MAPAGRGFAGSARNAASCAAQAAASTGIQPVAGEALVGAGVEGAAGGEDGGATVAVPVPGVLNENQLRFTKSPPCGLRGTTNTACRPPGAGRVSARVTHACQPPVAVAGTAASSGPSAASRCSSTAPVRSGYAAAIRTDVVSGPAAPRSTPS
ncbi:hypothetical protein GCM10020218_024960 [Dactylosporangium vinaceum]